MTPIQLTADLLINDYDRLQYTVEHRTIKKDGEEAWKPLDYVRSQKSLVTIARQRMGDQYAALARSKAEEKFDAAGLAKQIEALHPKTSKGKPS